MSTTDDPRGRDLVAEQVAADPISARARKRHQRKRSSHPGVVLIPPVAEDRTAWRARYTDPDTDRLKWVRLEPLAVRTVEGRTAWAKRLAESLAKRRMQLAAGAPLLSAKPIQEAIDRYYTGPGAALRPRTRDVYQEATNVFAAWAERAGVRTTDDLTRAKLVDFRDHIVNARKHAMRKGARRGTRKRTAQKRSAHTINRLLRTTGTVLRFLHKVDLLPRMSRDDLTYALEKEDAPVDLLDFLRPEQCRALVNAAIAHDGARFTETREEHARKGTKGTTPRYDPIAPLVTFLLLTGCRIGEALALRWDSVDLHAEEIHLAAGATKTARARSIDLTVCPTLAELLQGMEQGAAGAYVFGGTAPLRRTLAEAARKRLLAADCAGPRFTWQTLRRTCGTVLTNAPAIFGSASAYRSAKQLGHAVEVAERHYVGVLRGIAADARTIEDAIGLRTVMAEIVKAASNAKRCRQA